MCVVLMGCGGCISGLIVCCVDVMRLVCGGVVMMSMCVVEWVGYGGECVMI